MTDRLAKESTSETNPLVIVQHEPAIGKNYIENVSVIQEEVDWRDKFIEYLTNRDPAANKTFPHALTHRAARYIMLNEVLYMRGATRPLLRCLNQREAVNVLQDLHEGEVGHIAGTRA